MESVYDTLRWAAVRSRALRRDGERCTVARLLGGECSTLLHAHHIFPVSAGGDPFDLDNVGTTCAAHHPMWEALRRQLVERLLERDRPPRCPHRHRSAAARRECEARMNRRRDLVAA